MPRICFNATTSGSRPRRLPAADSATILFAGQRVLSCELNPVAQLAQQALAARLLVEVSGFPRAEAQAGAEPRLSELRRVVILYSSRIIITAAAHHPPFGYGESHPSRQPTRQGLPITPRRR